MVLHLPCSSRRLCQPFLGATTIQKFCEAIGELNTRRNIICFSDEAHRTQIRLSNKIKVVELKDIEANVEQTSGGALAVRMIDESKIGAFVTKPYAEQLRTAFPNATFVGFTSAVHPLFF